MTHPAEAAAAPAHAETAVSVLSDAERDAVAAIPDRIAAGPDCCFFCWAGERDRELVQLLEEGR